LGHCGEQLLYGVLQQQLLLHDGVGTHVVLPKLKRLLEIVPAFESSSSNNGTTINTHAGRELLRRHAFMKLCQSLTAAVATVQDAATPPAEEGAFQSPEGHWLQQQQQAQQATRIVAQRDLMLAIQLLEIAGGCTTCASSSSAAAVRSQISSDLRAELSILTDVLDLCLHWMGKGQDCHPASETADPWLQVTAGPDCGAAAAPAAVCYPWAMQGQEVGSRMLTTTAAEHAVSMQIVEGTSTSSSLCHELLCSMLRVLQHTASAAVQDQYKGGLSEVAAAEAHQPSPSTLPAPGAGTVPARQQWAAIGSSLLHHLDLVLSLAAASTSAQGPQMPSRSGSQPPAGQEHASYNHLPLATLDLYLEVSARMHT
jgi:hypothetical protein